MAVRILLDENLSERLLLRIGDIFPGSNHVRRLGEGGAHDFSVWAIARDQNFILVTRDEDFVGLSVLHGSPPKVIWLNIGNAQNATIESLLRARAQDIEQFAAQAEHSFLVIGSGT